MTATYVSEEYGGNTEQRFSIAVMPEVCKGPVSCNVV